MGALSQDPFRKASHAHLVRSFVRDQLAGHNTALLPIRYEDVLTLEQLDMHHRDPFDRMLVAQATANGLSLLTDDAALSDYPLSIIW